MSDFVGIYAMINNDPQNVAENPCNVA